MKKFFFFAIALTVSAMSIFVTSCEKNSINEEMAYAIDIDKVLAKESFDVTKAGGQISLDVNLPFDARLVTPSELSMEKKGNKFELSLGGNSGYTTTHVAYVSNIKAGEKVKGFGFFYYPFVIRQEGTKGMSYLSENDLKVVKNEKKSNWTGNQKFIKGVVKSVSDVKPYAGILRKGTSIGDYYDFPLCPQLNADSSKPFDLECRDLVVESEGVEISVRAAWHKAYKLVSKMNVKTGDSVEIYVDNKGIMTYYDTDLTVNPLYIVVIN